MAHDGDGDHTVDDALAATIAPVSKAPVSPIGPTPIAMQLPADLAADATVAAPSTDRRAPAGSTASSGRPPENLDAEATSSLLPEVPASHYRTDRELARGGMGRIVAAEDRRLGRPVALKELIDPAGDTVGRFQREALITARLQHPGIVPVYEAGVWPSGEPFFAMKLVSGRPLDRVIADARSLDDRLALLPRIAAATDAMAYAHAQRVIHRDLKPGNILIGDFGETVVIDWGLAKDLDSDSTVETLRRPPPSTAPVDPTMPEPATVKKPPSQPKAKSPTDTSEASTMTMVGAVMGTPAYMAPEQARGEQVDQRADVFALGAMLYHLLAGTPPYNARTATDVIAAAALGKVVPLTEREKRAPQDLVAIVERAMAPDPTDRYQHAGELADELRRFLTGQLVGAHEYSWLERVGRFVKRHRAAVVIGLLAAATIGVGGAIAVRRVISERDRAQSAQQIAIARQAAAEQLVGYIQRDVREMLVAIGRLDLLTKLGNSITDYFAALGRVEGGMVPDDSDCLAEASYFLGDAQMSTGNVDGAAETWTDARSRIARIVDNDTTPATFVRRRWIAKFDAQLGWAAQQRGKLDKAATTFGKARDELATLKQERPADHDTLIANGDVMDHLGDLLRTDGKVDLAFDAYTLAAADREKAASQGNTNATDDRIALSTSNLKLGSIYQARGETTVALEKYKAATRQRAGVLQPDPENVEYQEKVLEAETNLADLERQVGDDASAIATYRDALPVIDSLLRRDPMNAVWRRQRGLLYSDFGYTLDESGELVEGPQRLATAIEIERDLMARDPGNSRFAMEVSRTEMRIGDSWMYLGDVDQGIEHYTLTLDLRKQLHDKDAKSVAYRRSLAWSLHKLATAMVVKNEPAKAAELFEQALELRAKLADEVSAIGDFKNELAGSELEYARLLAATGKDPKRATELAASAVRRARALVATDPINNDNKETLTQALLAAGEVARATGDVGGRRAALEEAAHLASEIAKKTANVRYPGYEAEATAGLADLATARGDAKGATAAWKHVRELLQPLADTKHLAANRKALLDRAGK